MITDRIRAGAAGRVRSSCGGFAARVLAALVALSCLGCSGGGGAATQNGARPSASVSPPPSASAQSQQDGAAGGGKVYRGSLSNRGVTLRLTREGGRLGGSYSYDGIGQELRLEGRDAGGGKFTLAEFDAAGKQTGQFACELAGGDPDISCDWTKPDGGGRVSVALFEQHSDFKSAGLRVVPKVTENPKLGVRASYPQLAADAGAQLPPAAADFNRVVERRTEELVRDFTGSVEPGQQNLYFRTDYNVLLATDDLVSVELTEDSYAGGAHPNLYYKAVTYDLRAGRELKLEELFAPGSGYEKTLRDYSNRQVRERARGMGEESALPEDLLAEVSAWGLTPRGLMVYYDLPHAVAVFQRNFVPYEVVGGQLRADGPAAALSRAARK